MKRLSLIVVFLNTFLFCLKIMAQDDLPMVEVGQIQIIDADETSMENDANPYFDVMSGTIIDVSDKKIYEAFSEFYMSFEEFFNLIKGDVFDYYNLGKKYKTPLQREEFKKTEEYKRLYSELKEVREEVLANEVNIIYNLRYNKPYNINKKAFDFSIGIAETDVTTKPGYIGLGKDVCVTYPMKYTKIEKVRLNDNYSLKQLITIPYSDTSVALRIEKDMENPYCSTYLLFKVKVQSVEREKRKMYFGGYIQQTSLIDCEYLLCKTTGLYIINEKDLEILCDLSKILK